MAAATSRLSRSPAAVATRSLACRGGFRIVLLTALASLLACAGPNATPSIQSESRPAVEARGAPKRLTVAILAEPESFYRPLLSLGHTGQAGDVADLVTGGLTVADDHKV